MQTEDLFDLGAQFGIDVEKAEPLVNGLINRTWTLTAKNGRRFILQRINTSIFKEPQKIQENFEEITPVLKPHYTDFPSIVKTTDGRLLFEAGEDVYRCITFVENSTIPQEKLTEDLAFTTARCFGNFTRLLSNSSATLQTILPGFHDLALRADQLVEAKSTAKTSRLEMAAPLLDICDDFSHLLKLYDTCVANPQQFRRHILHHDCKPSNILFHTGTGELICPIDFDTTQPGLFYSDLGDMIRSMVPSHDENHKHIEDLEIQQNLLKALTAGYLEASDGAWSKEEKEAMPYAGQILLYMQGIRFLADFLNGDTYYRTEYENHNFDRAANQFRALQLLAKN